MQDAIFFCLQPCFCVLYSSRLICPHLLFFSPSISCSHSRLGTGRQLVQKQAPCPPPQTQRWRNWTLSTLSSYSSTSNVSTVRQAGRQAAFSALNAPLHFHFHPHTLIYTRSWFLISRRGSCLSYFVFCKHSKPTLCFSPDESTFIV